MAQLQRLIEAEVRSQTDSAVLLALDSQAEAVRGLRQASSESAVAALLIGAGASDRSSICLKFDGEFAHSGATRFAIHDSPALVSVIETKDTVVTAATSRELSAPLESLLQSEEKAQLTPVVARGAVRMVLVTASSSHPGELALLCEAAGLRLEVLELEQSLAAPQRPASTLR